MPLTCVIGSEVFSTKCLFDHCWTSYTFLFSVTKSMICKHTPERNWGGCFCKMKNLPSLVLSIHPGAVWVRHPSPTGQGAWWESVTLVRCRKDKHWQEAARSTLRRVVNAKQKSGKKRKNRDAIQWSAGGLAAYVISPLPPWKVLECTLQALNLKGSRAERNHYSSLSKPPPHSLLF